MYRSLPGRRAALAAAVTGVAVAMAATFVVTSSGDDAAATRRTAPRSTRVSAGPSTTPRPAQWSVPSTGGEPMGVTADADGVVAVSYQSVQSIDAGGSELWHTAIGRTPDIAPVRAAIDHDLVAVPVSSGVTLLARADGSVRWTARFGVGLEDAGFTGPVALAHPAGATPTVIGAKGGTVAAFDGATGTVRWKVRFDGDVVAAPAVDETRGVALVLWHPDRGEGALRALDLVTGAVRWEVATLEKTAAPLVHGGAVLLSEGDGNSHARVRALDPASGVARWQTAVPKSFEWETEPGAAGDDYVTVDHFGTATDLDVRTGAVRWQRSGDWALLDTQVVVGDRLVAFHDFNGHVVVLDRAGGEVLSVTVEPDVTDSTGRDGRLVTAVNQPVARRFEARQLG